MKNPYIGYFPPPFKIFPKVVKLLLNLLSVLDFTQDEQKNVTQDINSKTMLYLFISCAL